jgi:hypothetical protein
MPQIVLIVSVLALLFGYVSWTESRLDRLAARVDAAWAALDAQLVRRAAAAGHLAAYERRHQGLAEEPAKALEHVAFGARHAGAGDRQDVENDLTRSIKAALATGALRGTRAADLLEDLRDASTKVDFARQFYNDAVLANRSLRRRWLPRLLCRFRHDPPMGFFEIADAAIPFEWESSVPGNVA